MSLADKLTGKKVLVTGVTGFVGEALLHRILGDLPGTTVVAIIRPKGSLTGTDRMAQLLKKDIFKPFYGEGTEHADAEALTAARIEVVEGDLSDVPELPKDLDIVVHCAGDVSFDPPIHEAFTTNVLGTKSLLERIVETGTTGALRAHLHRVHRGSETGRDPRGAGRAQRRLAGRGRGRDGDEGPDRGGSPAAPRCWPSSARRPRSCTAGPVT